MNIQIKPYENFDEAEIVELYSSVGWTVYAAAPDMLKRAYAGSMCVLGAYDGEKLVGIVRGGRRGKHNVYTGSAHSAAVSAHGNRHAAYERAYGKIRQYVSNRTYDGQ